MKPILVVGATGTVGGEVLAQLRAAGVEVRGMARNPEGPGMVRGDLTAPETLAACLDGVDAVFLVWTAPGAAVAPALERIAKHARRIVYLSAPLKTPHPFFQQPNPNRAIAEEIERRIEASGMEWTFLRPGMFAANALGWWARQIRAGDVVRWPFVNAPTAPIDERDIAAVGVKALCEDGHSGAEYVITGPEELTQGEQITIIGEAIGRPLRVEELSPEEARRELFPGLPEFVVKMLFDAWGAAIGIPAHRTSTFAEVMGRPPRTFREWAQDHRRAFGCV